MLVHRSKRNISFVSVLLRSLFKLNKLLFSFSPSLLENYQFQCNWGRWNYLLYDCQLFSRHAMNYVKRAMKTIINRFEVDISLYPARFRKKKIFSGGTARASWWISEEKWQVAFFLSYSSRRLAVVAPRQFSPRPIEPARRLKSLPLFSLRCNVIFNANKL